MLAWQLGLGTALVLLSGLIGAFVAVERTTVGGLRSSVDAGLQTQVREWRRSVAGIRLDSPVAVERAARSWLAQQRDHPSTQLQIVDVAGGTTVTNHPGVLGVELAHEQAEQADPDLAAGDDPVGGLLDAPQGLATADTVDLGPVRVVTEPIRWDGRQVGVLRVADSLQPVTRTEARLQRTFLLVGAAALGLGAPAAAAASALALRPLRRLAAVAASVDAGELDRRAGPTGRGEVAALARAFDRMLDRLQAAFAQQAQFVGDASHELRTPLSVARVQAELLAEERDDAARRAGVRVVLSRLGALEGLVCDLLTLARAGVEQLHRPEPVPVADLLADLERDLPLFGDRDYRVEHRSGTLQADPNRLTQVLHNLVRNAVQHTASGGHVSVTACPAGGRLTITVEDDGTGIAPEDLPFVFERFYRARTGADGGSGLGLSIAKALVEAHGGQLRAWSRPGRGTRMSVELPGYTPPAQAPAPAPAPAPRA